MPSVSLQSLLRYRIMSQLDSGTGAAHSNSSTWCPPLLLLIGEAAPATVMPRVTSSAAPAFGRYVTVEDTSAIISLPAFEPEDQDTLLARIIDFPAHGTLFQLQANGSRGPPVPKAPTAMSETLVSQWVHEVVGMSSEWTTSESQLELVNMTMAEILGGTADQSVYGACYCALGVLGPPDCSPENYDCAYTWAAVDLNCGKQYLDLKFQQAVIASQVCVFFV